jgi:2-polyprenyl-6-methoxyphenol hydroxylase-like FAD-dependent oxidoreductase
MNAIASATRTDVLIVGAGPTGLALALMLRQAGASPLVVDKLHAGHNTSRAAVIHAHTLDVLEPLGVTGRLMSEGLRLKKLSVRDRDRVLTGLNFDDLPTRHSCLLMVPPDRTEQALRDALADAGGSIEWGCEVRAITQLPADVLVEMQSPNGPRLVLAKYVVGADGMNSIVRKTAGIAFSGTRYEESFVLADVDMQWGPGRDEVMTFFSPEGLVVVAPLPGGERFRIVATYESPPDHPDVTDIQTLLDRRGPTSSGARVSNVVWSARFRVHHRVADRYRNGRLLIVGDAAHVHSPAGGQGMNTGLVDACVLGRLLADVISGNAADDALDRYETARRPAALSLLQLAKRLTAMATMKGSVLRAVRNLLFRFIGLSPIASRQLTMNLSGLSRREAAAPYGN